MNKISNIYNMPIISIDNGKEIGKVKEVILNTDNGNLAYVAIENTSPLYGALMISHRNILGIGDNAITIENTSVLQDIHRVADIPNLLKKDVKITDSKIITKSGKLIGKAGNVFIDSNNCKILGIEFLPADALSSNRIIPMQEILTFGQDITVVKDDTLKNLVDKLEDLKIEKKYRPSFANERNEKTFSDITYGKLPSVRVSETLPKEDIYDEPVEPIYTEKPEPVSAEGNVEPPTPFEEKQKQYLLGKTITKTVYSSSGNVIINKGEEITEQKIAMARQAGKLIELVMNNKAK